MRIRQIMARTRGRGSRGGGRGRRQVLPPNVMQHIMQRNLATAMAATAANIDLANALSSATSTSTSDTATTDGPGFSGWYATPGSVLPGTVPIPSVQLPGTSAFLPGTPDCKLPGTPVRGRGRGRGARTNSRKSNAKTKTASSASTSASTSKSKSNAGRNWNDWDLDGEFSETRFEHLTPSRRRADSSDDDDDLKPDDDPIAYQEDGAMGIAETYSDYKPAKLLLGIRHPDAVVETASLASVLPPDVSYKLTIPSSSIHNGCLSALQLESVIYACQQHENFLESMVRDHGNGPRAGFLIGDGAGVGKGRMISGIIYENFLQGRKKAIWVSVSNDLKYDAERDFADIGAKINVVSLTKIKYGKIEELSKAVIFCTYASLIGSTSKNVKYNTRMKQLVRWCGKDFDGVIAFDECHRAKNLYNPLTQTPTKTGMAVFNIQEYLPNARIVYASATGASEPKDMAYMTRLGIWGHNTTFGKFEDFSKAVDKRGIGAMEIVAMDMKMRGVYIARQLSFQEVTFDVIEAPLTEEFTEIYDDSVELWVELREKFQEAADLLNYGGKMLMFMWRIFWSAHQRYFKCLCISSKIPQAIKETEAAIASGKCVVIGLQTTGEARTLETLEENDGELDEFVSTALGTLQSLVQKHFPDEEKVEQVRLASMGKLVRGKHAGRKTGGAGQTSKRKAGPTQGTSKRSKGASGFGASLHDSDNDGNSGSDSDGDFDLPDEEDSIAVMDRLGMPKDLLQNAKAAAEKRAKKKAAKNLRNTGTAFSSRHSFTPRNDDIRLTKEYLLEKIDTFGERLPRNCLDDLINAFGGSENVAEMTGRKGRVVKGKDGTVQYESRSSDEVPLEFVNLAEKQNFMEGTKKIAIISEAASSGISLQSDKRAANTLRRVHITLELPWSADRAIQQFGRTHRSNQVNAPEYVFIVSSLAGEHRFASIVAKRLESLGALTHGDRRATETRDLSRFHVHTKFGQKALSHVIKAVAGVEGPLVQPKFDVGADQDDFFDKVRGAMSGVGLMEEYGPHTEDSITMTKFLNRILGIPVKIQNDLFQFFLDTLQYKIMDAKRRNKFDQGIMDLGDSGSGAMERVSVTTYTREHSTGKGKIELQNLVVERGLNWTEAVFKFAELSDPKEGFYLARQEKNGHREVILIVAAKPVMIDGVQIQKKDKTVYSVYRPNSGLQMGCLTWHEIDKKFMKTIPDNIERHWIEQFQSFKTKCYHVYWIGRCRYTIMGDDCDTGLRQKSYFILSGAVLLVWSVVEQVLQHHCGPKSKIQVVRVRDTDQKMVGILIPKSCVEDLKQALELESNEVKEVKNDLPLSFA